MIENSQNEKVERWIIDTDPGCDDLMALIYMMNRKDVKVEFITLAEGNCKMHDVVKNIKKIYKMIGRSYPTYPGSTNQLYNGAKNAYDYHFNDGLGDIDEIKKIDTSEIVIDTSKIAAVEIVSIANEYPGEINLLCLAPSTNLALAYMLDSSIGKKFKSILIMAGSLQFTGNVSSASEFNVYHDFLATSLFFKHFKNLLIVTWEPTEKIYFNNSMLEKSKKIAIERYGSLNENVAFFTGLIIEKYSRKRIGVQICDLYTCIAYFNPKSVKEYNLSNQKVIIDSDCFKGACYIFDTEFPTIKYEDLFNDYYLKGKEYVKDKNIYPTKLDEELIIEEFSTILKP